MDHHCPWINTCVGAWNQPYFLGFIVSAPVGCIYAGYVHGVYLSYRWGRRRITGAEKADYAGELANHGLLMPPAVDACS
jgi:hypothetical protein